LIFKVLLDKINQWAGRSTGRSLPWHNLFEELKSASIKNVDEKYYR